MRLIAILLLLYVSTAATSAPLTVAVASNFRITAEDIAVKFTAETGHEVRISSGSTGKLYAQIVNGAPFDLFLAADAERPQILVDSDLGVDSSRFTYAIGTLAFWSGDAKCSSVMESLGTQRLAIANPKTSPYGKAAQEFLQSTGRWQSVSQHLVFGENVAQTLHFAVTGNVGYALVAASQVIDPRLPQAGCTMEVPVDSYTPIQQQVVLLRRAKDNPAAISFLKFLQSAETRATIRASGYGVP